MAIRFVKESDVESDNYASCNLGHASNIPRMPENSRLLPERSMNVKLDLETPETPDQKAAENAWV